MRKLTVVGIGMGQETVTREGMKAIEAAELLMGAPRMLECFSDLNKKSVSAYTPDQVAAAMEKCSHGVVLVSGDTGFYSAAEALCRSSLWETELIPGISSMAYFFSRIRRSWQDAAFLSCHGRSMNLVDTVRRNALTFALTGGNVRELAGDLCNAGFEELTVYVGSNLGSDRESIRVCTARELTEADCPSLTVLVVENRHPEKGIAFGLPEDAFVRGNVPMTKPEVRAVTMSKLNVQPEDICLDIGAGTGSVTVEMGLAAWAGHVYAVDKNPEAVELIRQNCRRFHLGNVTALEGTVPEVLEQLPAPDVVFIGGSSGTMDALFSWILGKNPRARIVVNAIVLETVQQSTAAFEKWKIPCEIVQIQASRAKKVGNMHMMMGQNPVYIISGGGQ